MSTLASVYHKPANTFISQTRLAVQKAEDMKSPLDADSPSDSIEVSVWSKGTSVVYAFAGNIV